jgi:hypothetical protein
MNTGNKQAIFLSINKTEQSKLEKRLLLTLQRAGFSVSSKNNEESVEVEIQNSFCSIHFIGKKHFENSDGISVSEQHFNEARKKIEKDPNYKTFIWVPGKFDDSDADRKQLDFINRMQHHLSNNMILSRVSSAIQFVEDVRLILEQQEKKIYETLPADVFFIYNKTDEKEALRIQTMLSGVLNFVKLVIVQDSDINYEEYAAQQMNASKLSVIYYKTASDWAHPFVQQIWKKVGGAGAISPILYISDSAQTGSEPKKFTAPRVTNFNLPIELIPLEIKVQFDALKEDRA